MPSPHASKPAEPAEPEEEAEVSALRAELNAARKTERGFERYKEVIEETLRQRSAALVRTMQAEQQRMPPQAARNRAARPHTTATAAAAVGSRSAQIGTCASARPSTCSGRSEAVAAHAAVAKAELAAKMAPAAMAQVAATCVGSSGVRRSTTVGHAELAEAQRALVRLKGKRATSASRTAPPTPRPLDEAGADAAGRECEILRIENSLLRAELEAELAQLQSADVEVHAMQLVCEERRGCNSDKLAGARRRHSALTRAEVLMATEVEQRGREIASLESELSGMRAELAALRLCAAPVPWTQSPSSQSSDVC